MDKIIIKKAQNLCKREDSTMVRIDRQLHEKIKVISEQTDFSVQYIVNLLLNEAVNAVVIEELEGRLDDFCINCIADYCFMEMVVLQMLGYGINIFCYDCT